MTYLELCRTVARECGLTNWDIPNVTGVTDHELNKVIGWVAAADLDVVSRWEDWKFLWREWDNGTLAANSNVPDNVPANAGHWDIDCFYLNYGTPNNRPLEWEYWPEYKSHAASGLLQGVPSCVTQTPRGELRVNQLADTAYSVSGEYTELPIPLVADAQASQIPESYRRIIVARAKVYYAEHHDISSITAGSLAEHTDLLEKLESRYRSADAGRRGTIKEKQRDRRDGGQVYVP